MDDRLEKLKLPIRESPNRPGTVVFCSYADQEKLSSLFSQGILPRGGVPRRASYFPNSVSLSVIDEGGYNGTTTGIEIGWVALYAGARMNGNLDWSNTYRYALILSDGWLKSHRRNITLVGDGVVEGYVPLLPFLKDCKVFSDEEKRGHAFFEEIHFDGGAIPPTAFAGVLIDHADPGEALSAFTNLRDATKKSKPSHPLPVFSKVGEMVDIV